MAIVRRQTWPAGAASWWAPTLVFLATALFAAFLLLNPGDQELMTMGDDLGTVACELIGVFFCAIGVYHTWSRAGSPEGGHPLRVLTRCAVPIAFGIGILCTATGDSIWAWYEVVLKREVPIPSWADAFYLSGNPCFLLGILLMLRHRLSGVARTRRVLDSVMIIAAAVTFSWYFVLGPTLLQGAGSLAEKLVNAAYPFSDLILIGCIALLWNASLGPRDRAFVGVLTLALLSIIVTDSVYAYQSLQGVYATGELIDTGWPLGYLLMGLSALFASDIIAPGAAECPQSGMKRGWHDLLPFALLPAMGVLLVVTNRLHGPPALSVGVDVGAGVLVGLVALRQLLALHESNDYARALERLNVELRGLHSDKSALSTANQQLEVLATTDTLTGLPNRGLLGKRLASALEQAMGDDSMLALLLLDLDRFKEVNDALGHQVGDQLLVQVAARLRGKVRRTDTVARLGGDEFAVVLPTADAEVATTIARGLRAVIEAPFVVEEQSLSVGVSIGIALAPTHGLTQDVLLRHADVAMYVAKREGVGYAFYDLEQDDYDAGRLGLVADLQRAIGAGELTLHYQPKVAIVSGAVIGVEALVRWAHPVNGLIPPDRFIPLAEQTGLIIPLTAWVLEAALTQCAEWADAGLVVAVAVNLSLRNLRDQHLCETVAALLRRHGVPAERLCLELTESVVMADAEGTHTALEQLAALGVRLSIDDFGTGYSSLAYLSRLPVNELKIDQSFIRRMAEYENDQIIVASTIALGHSLGMSVVTEGVEDSETLAILGNLGSDAAQGYFVSKPLPAPAAEAWLRRAVGERLPALA